MAVCGKRTTRGTLSSGGTANGNAGITDDELHRLYALAKRSASHDAVRRHGEVRDPGPAATAHPWARWGLRARDCARDSEPPPTGLSRRPFAVRAVRPIKQSSTGAPPPRPVPSATRTVLMLRSPTVVIIPRLEGLACCTPPQPRRDGWPADEPQEGEPTDDGERQRTGEIRRRPRRDSARDGDGRRSQRQRPARQETSPQARRGNRDRAANEQANKRIRSIRRLTRPTTARYSRRG
jgi:hypothetical protein